MEKKDNLMLLYNQFKTYSTNLNAQDVYGTLHEIDL